MEIFEVNAHEYAEVVRTPYQAFNSSKFNELNKEKCDKIHYLLFRQGKYRLGLIAGAVNGHLRSPYSAPFGSFSYISSNLGIEYFDEAIDSLQTWARNQGLGKITITLPPSFYDSQFMTRQFSAYWRSDFKISQVDLNHFFDLNLFDENYPSLITYNGRRNLRIALASELNFAQLQLPEQKKLSYDIIRQNRESRGYPLRMSWSQVNETSTVIDIDFFMVSDSNGQPVSSAIVFHVSPQIVQVVYWGDLPGFSNVKPMNYLAFKLFEHYKRSGKNIVDLGPSTEASIPNLGLCEFKESIGCSITHKLTFVADL